MLDRKKAVISAYYMGSQAKKGLDTLLADYRTREQLLSLTVIIDDPKAKRVLAAWLTYSLIPPWSLPECAPPVDDRARWLWLWEKVWNAIDFDDFGPACGLSPVDAEGALRTCINARLVYPDGEISKGAKALLRAHIEQLLPRPRRKKS